MVRGLKTPICPYCGGPVVPTMLVGAEPRQPDGFKCQAKPFCPGLYQGPNALEIYKKRREIGKISDATYGTA